MSSHLKYRWNRSKNQNLQEKTELRKKKALKKRGTIKKNVKKKESHRRDEKDIIGKRRDCRSDIPDTGYWQLVNGDLIS